ncbi:histone-like nucleoid-structuring protein, MvaT/MvaU family [Pseudomonas sp.]|uniref:histone-like nucleoid-structuring protein, MvaT/MvaU family n=1 Tax=Pseudomonas sp. TaxID=306 RepID=UPI0028AC28EE|nr:histone-like nucleoid-structuring protein, MvaT/MvaU family [Pseudomonas sp.]
MSKLAEFRALEQKLAEQLAQMESMKSDAGLKKEMEFEEKLKALMTQYDKGLRDIVDLLDVSAASSSRGASKAAPARQRKERVLKVYKNPKTGELVETKGGNHKVLKAWKEQHGAQTVESWLQ